MTSANRMIMELVSTSYIWVPAEEDRGYQIQAHDVDDDGEFFFIGIDEETQTESIFRVADVDAENDLFYKLVLQPVPEAVTSFLKAGEKYKHFG